MKRIIIFLCLIILSFSIKAQKKKEKPFECIICINQQAEFRGGNDSLRIFLAKNLKYPKTNACVKGKVYVQFIIEKDGRITHPIILKSLEQTFDKEALRVIRLMPKWNPARDYRGKNPIASRLTLPIKFEIEE